MQPKKQIDIQGSKGGGDIVEDTNTLQSVSAVQTLELLSAGPIKGLVNGQKSIFFDNVPVEQVDGTKTYDIQTDIRLGLPDQPPMSGYPSSESLFVVGSEIDNGLDAIYTSSVPDVDSMRLVFNLYEGLYYSADNGLKIHDIEIDIHRADASGVYSYYTTWSLMGRKSMSPYVETIDIPRTNGSGTWSVKCVKKTPDYGDKSHNKTKLDSVVEIKNIELQFNNFAYVGLKIPSKEVSNKNPDRAYLVDGIICQIPSNYDPYTAQYSGEWDGELKADWTNNPVWIVYDMLTNEDYGCGHWVKPEDIDIYSFYDAAYYCDGRVPDGKGNQERRFTFNGVLNQQEDWIKVLQNVCGSFNSVLIKEGHLYRIQQDRPETPSAVITNADVIDGTFTYAGTSHNQRHTMVNVTFGDSTNMYKSQVITVEASPSDIERFNGYTTADITAIGCTSEGQAIRAGRWYIDTQINQKETVSFSMGFNGMLLRLGDVIKVADSYYSGITNSGRVIGVEGDDLIVDRPVSYAYGDKVNFVTSLGQFAEVTLTSSGTGTDRITLPFGMGNPVGSSFSIETLIKNRQFRITEINHTEPNVIEISAILHDPDKYTRIEQGITVVTPPYSTVNNTRAKQVTNISFTVSAFNDDGVIRRDLVVSWTPPVGTAVKDYLCQYRSNSGAWTSLTTSGTSFDITRISEGTYDVKIITNAVNGTSSIPATGTYEYSLSGGTGSLLNQVQNLWVTGSTSTSFFDNDLTVTFQNPITNTSLLGTLKDFRIDIKDLDDNILRTSYVKSVPAGDYQEFTYPFLQNKQDHDGTASRNVKVTVYCRDSNNKLSIGSTKTFSNPAPAAPAITSTSGTKSIKIEVTTPVNRVLDPDYIETAFFVSDVPDFVPTLEGAAARGQMSFYMLQGVESVKYFAVAYVDSFGDDLNWSVIGSDAPGTAAGIPEVTVLPNSPADVDGMNAVMYKAPGSTEYQMWGWTGTEWMNTRDGGYLVEYSIAASKIYAEELRAISAHLGDMESGSITFDQASFIRGGALSWTTGSGIWMGYDNNNYKFRIGSPIAGGMEWDGNSIKIYDNSHNLVFASGSGLYVGNTPASTVEFDLSSVKQSITDMAADNVLTPLEKQSLKTQMQSITAVYNQLDLSASQLGVITERSTHTSYYSILNSYVNGLIADLTTNSTIVAATYRANFSNYYDSQAALQKAISKKAADKGAVIGTNLYQGSSLVSGVVNDLNPITGTNISTYMAAAAIDYAQIKYAAVDTLTIKGNAVTVPSGGNGIYSASASITLPQPGYITVIGTFTQGTGKGGHTWRLYIGGNQVVFENPAVSTTGAMSYTAYVGAGGQNCAIQCDQQSGDGRCSITVLGSMR